MNTYNTDNLQPGQQPASAANKPLWAAVGILGVAVLAMGGFMIYQQSKQSPPAEKVALAAPSQAALGAPSMAASATAADDMIEKPAAAAKPAPVPVPAQKVVKPKPVPKPQPATAGVSPSPSSVPVPVAVAPAPVCGYCGSIESVTPVTRSTKPPGVGVGTVAGGVLGAVLGNQIGQGNGRTLGTIIGAVGGGFAGNAIEGQMRKETVYQVNVRMEDGSHRTIEVAQPPAVGSRVTVEGSTIRSNDGAVYRAPAPVTPNVVQPAPVQQGG
ncbi:MAG: glycine zipper 2TM domain-containing protein [Polaromonas sp.]|uniref:glycine zipper 2TM domain-containing protein n=1 Tax=Polaromonas sp. TaxID=1869339 RepID=UPI0025DA2503|nr:glycine zipper 2TM domain-containing protein [Polaromonas sp.]MBI2727776.1 glycine zipper 2TM domain-containing protein [Polaromonas sp.]